MRRPAKPAPAVRDPEFKRTYDRTLRKRRFAWHKRDRPAAYRFAESLLLDLVTAEDRDGRNLLALTLTLPAAISLEDARAALGAFMQPTHDDEGSWFVEEIGKRGGHHFHGFELVRAEAEARRARWRALTGASQVKADPIWGSTGVWERANATLVRGIATWMRYVTKAPGGATRLALRFRTRATGALAPLWAAAVAGGASHSGDLLSRGTGRSIATKPSTCAVCGTFLALGRSDRVYCTPSCRTKAWRTRRREEERREMEQREQRQQELDARRRRRADEDARLAALARTLGDWRVVRPSSAHERTRLLALADFLADAEPPCPIDHVPLESDPLIGRWLVTLSPDEVECFAERAAIIEESAGVDRERAEWLAFSELEPRFATKRAA